MEYTWTAGGVHREWWLSVKSSRVCQLEKYLSKNESIQQDIYSLMVVDDSIWYFWLVVKGNVMELSVFTGVDYGNGGYCVKWCWVVLSCVTTVITDHFQKNVVITVATLVLSPQVWWVNWHDRNSIHGHKLQQLCLSCGCGYSYSWLTLGTSTATTKSVQQKLCARWSHSCILHSPVSFHGVLMESSQSPWSPCRVLIEFMETPWGLHEDSMGTL